jgi:hypothetical protein
LRYEPSPTHNLVKSLKPSSVSHMAHSLEAKGCKDLQQLFTLLSLFLLSSFIVTWPIVWNKFPLLFWDDSYYLSRAFLGTPTLDRPIYYSYFLYLFHSFPFSLYVAAAAQAVITVALITYLLTIILPPISSAFLTFILCCAIALTPTTKHIVTLMPDVGVLWLAISATVALASRGTLDLCIAIFITIASIAFHNSILPIFLCLSPVLIFLSVMLRSTWRMVGYICAVSISALFLIVFNNWLAGLRAFESPTLFFLAGRLNETNTLSKSFQELADDEDDAHKRETYDLWARRLQELSGSAATLLWNSKSILNETFPRWYDNVYEYRAAMEIIRPAVINGLVKHSDTFLHSAKHNYTSMMVGEYLQLFQMGGLDSGPVYEALDKFWPTQLPYFVNSTQMTGYVNAEYVNAEEAFPLLLQIWKISMRSSLYLSPIYAALLAMAVVLAQKRNRSFRLLLNSSALFLGVFFANALVCSVFADLDTRYAERGYALFPLSVLLFLYALLVESRRKPVFAEVLAPSKTGRATDTAYVDSTRRLI